MQTFARCNIHQFLCHVTWLFSVLGLPFQTIQHTLLHMSTPGTYLFLLLSLRRFSYLPVPYLVTCPLLVSFSACFSFCYKTIHLYVKPNIVVHTVLLWSNLRLHVHHGPYPTSASTRPGLLPSFRGCAPSLRLIASLCITRSLISGPHHYDINLLCTTTIKVILNQMSNILHHVH